MLQDLLLKLYSSCYFAAYGLPALNIEIFCTPAVLACLLSASFIALSNWPNAAIAKVWYGIEINAVVKPT